jgi:hypothetical protein
MSIRTVLALAALILPLATPAPAAAGRENAFVKITNPGQVARQAETVAVRFADLRKVAAQLRPKASVVFDGAGQPVVSQLVDVDGDEVFDEIVFQTDLGPGESKVFAIKAGVRVPPKPAEWRAYGRFVRERYDDFAWENDRIARRMYGPALEGWKKEPLASSGIDCWTKRVRRLVVNDWYMIDDYHTDRGEGADRYPVKQGRGCGGLGIWAGDKLHGSRNFVMSRSLANGPIRVMFELHYAAWEADGVKVSEVKRITLDAGKNFDRLESTFRIEGKDAPLQVGLGISNHNGSKVEHDKAAGWMRTWEPMENKMGNLGCAIIVDPKAVVDRKQTALDYLVIVNAKAGTPLVYHAGFGWDRSGDFADQAAWNATVEAVTRQVAAPPLAVTVSAEAPRAGNK